MHRSLVLGSLLFVISSVACAGVSGVVTSILDHDQPARDGIAIRKGERIRIMISSEPFDWIEFASDGKLEFGDAVRHRNRGCGMACIKLEADTKGWFRNWDGTDVEPGVNPVGGWKLVAIEPGRIAATFKYASTNVSFDLPIEEEGSALVPADEPLTPDSEPFRALQAHMAAQKKRDLDAALATSMLPEELASVGAEDRARLAAALEPSPGSVTRIEFRGGRVAGAVAHVDYAAWARIVSGEARRARLVRVDGKWLVRNEIMH